MNTSQTSEILILGLLLAGALSTSYTVRSAANYANFYDAVASLEFGAVKETYTLQPETTASISFSLQNPTPYHGMRVNTFYFIPRSVQSPTGQLLLGLESYSIKTLTDLRTVEIPAQANLTLTAQIAFKGETVEQFRRFYQDQTGQVSLNYEAQLTLNTMLDKHCLMTLRFTHAATEISCRPGSFAASNQGI